MSPASLPVTSLALSLDSDVARWLLVLLVVGGVWAWLRITMRRRARQRLFHHAAPVEEARGTFAVPDGGLDRWLYLAGFRESSARSLFVLAEVGCALLAFLVVLLVRSSDVLAKGEQFAEALPGGLGAAMAPLYGWAPWIAGLALLLLPIAYVRNARRTRVELVEQDLPMTLELLASLAEAGQGLDSSIQRILTTNDEDRPLAEELQRFRAESLSGIPRKQSYRNLADRLDIPSVSVFVSALVHAEEVGAGTSATLRRQADELWSRRRETVLAQSQLLPTRLAVPLVVCFLPGILAVTLVPPLAQLMNSNLPF
ncbi:MAG: type II secretion system F family protein [Planctomycetota bacterium]